ncbi:MAG: nitrous oxide reductase accessory protein NosL [Acidobacteria bacterium]|nr:nitrous oxide reductase accessory protein NosL [Acidobacteriota bacterium]MCG3193189.1 hypothetical protein [Thermoanaerobaculia bacterium]
MERRHFLLSGVSVVLASWAQGADRPISKPGPKDVCPVCGMLVAKYANWIAIVEDKDGTALFFDGPKDMLKYVFNPAKYRPGRSASGITRIWVTEFYGLTRIDARKALYISGSDVLGPMGHDLVPLSTRAEAEEFLRDHKGRRIYSFDEIPRDLPAKLDAGRFE